MVYCSLHFYTFFCHNFSKVNDDFTECMDGNTKVQGGKSCAERDQVFNFLLSPTNFVCH